MKRKIIYHHGPTNSGKTYHAMESLKKAKTGCYLAPLRLLAFERYEDLQQASLKTCMITGEEMLGEKNASHYSCTVEMFPYTKTFEEVVLDEVQFMGDFQRGFAWTRAFLSMKCNILHVCGDDSLLELIQKMVFMIGDELELVSYKRLVPLEIEASISHRDLRPKDCLVAFSKKKVLEFQKIVKKQGKHAYVIYGLSCPEVRRAQAKGFEEDPLGILISTDAISMGLNLSIKRIVFSSLAKFFDGQEQYLTTSEVKQIAGRAGRYLKYDKGYVTCLEKEDSFLLKKHLSTALSQQQKALISPDYDLFLSLNSLLEEKHFKTIGLSEFLRKFSQEYFPKPFLCSDLSEQIILADFLEKRRYNFSLEEQFIFSLAPVNMNYQEIFYFYEKLCLYYDKKNPFNPLEFLLKKTDLLSLELNLKCLDIFFWIAQRFPFFQIEKRVFQLKEKIIEQIQEKLQ